MKNLYLSFCKFATLALMLGLTMRFLGFQSSNLLVQADSEENITICHATDSRSNPYVENTVDADSIINLPNGHKYHEGPVFSALLEKHVKWGDIIPEFSYSCEKSVEEWTEWVDGDCNSGDLKKENCEERTVGNGVFTVIDRPSELVCPDGYLPVGGSGKCENEEKEKVDKIISYLSCPTDFVIKADDSTKCQSTVEGTKTQSREKETKLVEDTCTFPGLNLENGSSILANGCVAPDACQETVKCDDACRTEDVTIQGSCESIVCEKNAESCEDEEDPTKPSMSSIISCGKIDMTFRNPTRWFFSFDYRVDEEDGTTDEVSLLNIANGPWAGQSFGLRYNMVDVLAGQVEERTVTFAEDSGTHKVEYRLWRGAENDMYLNWVSKTVESDCQEPSASPTPSPSPSPSPTEPPGYTCPVAQSCPTSCGQSAKDVPNGSCGLTHCGPTAPCDGGVGGTETSTTGQVLGATSVKSVATSSGQVLGATTYAATGIAEDIAFSLIGFTGAGLSGVGILLKRNEKNQK